MSQATEARGSALTAARTARRLRTRDDVDRDARADDHGPRDGDRARRRGRRRWPLALFALPFIVGCLWLAFGVVVPHVVDAARMQSWQQGEATLTSAGVHVSRSSDSVTYRAYATYTYRHGGRRYQGDRVAIYGGGDNIGGFQQTFGASLEQALAAEIPVPVFVNPDDPREAVLNRDLRWGLLGLQLVLLVVSGLVGFGVAWYALRRRPAPAAASADEPWRARAEWQTRDIECNSKQSLWAAWFFASLWNLVAIPAASIAMLELFDGNRGAIVALIFPLVGVGLLAWAIKTTASWRRFGRTTFVLDPFPGAIGGHVGGTIDVDLPYDGALFTATLTCLYSYVSGTGKNRRRRERLIWQSEGIADARAHLSGTRVEILFGVDEGLPPSDPEPAREYHLWRLHVTAELPGVDFDRSFEIPVFETRERARSLRKLSTEHALAVEHRAETIGRVLDVTRIPGGFELYYPPFKHPAPKVGALAVGLVFLGVGVLAGDSDFPAFLRGVFAVLGGITAVSSLYYLLLGLRVRIDAAGLEIRKHLLGVPAGATSVSRGDLRSLALERSYSASSGNKHTAYFKLLARTAEGKSFRIGHNLAGRETAQQALEALSQLTGIPIAEEEIRKRPARST